MKVADILRRAWVRFEGFTYALDNALEYDERTEMRARVIRLEKAVAELEKANG